MIEEYGTYFLKTWLPLKGPKRAKKFKKSKIFFKTKNISSDLFLFLIFDASQMC